MKLITRDTDYAIRSLTCISGSGEQVISVTDLIKRLRIPRPFLRKILQMLEKEGILKSYKGKGGGFSLAVPASRISIFDLVEIFQGPFEVSEHIFKGKTCPYIKTCKLKRKLDGIEGIVVKRLKAIKIKDLLK